MSNILKDRPSLKKVNKTGDNKVVSLIIEAHNSYESKNFEQAYDFFMKALDKDPDNVLALHGLGLIALDNGMEDTSAEFMSAALEIDNDHIIINKNLALVYSRLNRIDDSIRHYKKVLMLGGSKGEIHGELARLYLLTGRMDDALKHCKKAFNLCPTDPRNFHALLQLDRNVVTEDMVNQVEDLLKEPELPLEDRSSFYFALGSMLDRDGDYDKAFANYTVANLSKASRYDSEKHEVYITQIIETFTAEFFRKHVSDGCSTTRPVFIVGMPRSGTTLVEQILASHPDVYAAGELNEINNIAREFSLISGSKKPYPLCFEDIQGDLIHEMALSQEHFIDSMASHNEPRVTDKMPGNFIHLGMIALLFPEAHIVHCQRNPLDTCLSCYFQNFRGNHSYASDLEHLGHYYLQYERLMTHWRKVLPITIHSVDYEKLVLDSVSTSKQLVAAVGLEWKDSCKEFYRTNRPVNTASIVQVRQPMYKTSLDRWRHYEKHILSLKKTLSPASSETKNTIVNVNNINESGGVII